MMIQYKETKEFSCQEIEELFLSVGWVSGKYPQQVVNALRGSSQVISAWDGDRLVGLIRALDDGCMMAYLHYLLVHPDYQGYGIASTLLNCLKEKYKDYLYVNITPDEHKNIAYYEKHGFSVMEDGAAMQLKNLHFAE